MLAILQQKYNSLSDAYDLLVSKNSRFIADKLKRQKIAREIRKGAI